MGKTSIIGSILGIMSLSILVIFSGFAKAQDKDVSILVIKDVRIFDGEKIIATASIVVENGKVMAFGPSAKIPVGAQVIDGSGKTLLPGLIDAHVHIWGQDKLLQATVFGVTAMVDMFTSVDFAAGVKKTQEAGPGPHLQAYLVSPMTLVTVAGGHGTEYGLKIPTLESASQAQAFIDARIAEGSDFIKIIYDDGSAYGYHLPTLSQEELAAVIKAAHARHKLAVVHCGSLKKCIEALEAGADGLAHLNFDDAYDPNFGKLAAARKAFIIPTLSVLESMNGHPDAVGIAKDEKLAPFLKPADLQGLTVAPPFRTSAGTYAAAERIIKQLGNAGVPILAGTDTPNPGTAFGAALHGELELLVRAGMTPVEVLKAATSLPADKFGMKGRGRIRTGFPADLVLVDGDPTLDIKATRAIVSVWKDGVRVNRDGYLKDVIKEREALERQKNAPSPDSLGSGLISDFEGDKIRSNFGSGWVVSTDSIMGGKSKADLSLTEDGAAGSRKSLLIKGTIAEAGSIRWAGAMFFPGAAGMAPANLSSKKALSFWAKGSGKSFAVMIYCQSTGFTPRIQPLEIGPGWKEYTMPFDKFGIDGHDIMGILIGAMNTPGDFAIWLDNVRLQ